MGTRWSQNPNFGNSTGCSSAMVWITVALQTDNPLSTPEAYEHSSSQRTQPINMSVLPFQNICSYLRRICIHLSCCSSAASMGDSLPPHAMIIRRILKLSRSGTKGLSGEFGQLLLRLGLLTHSPGEMWWDLIAQWLYQKKQETFRKGLEAP